MLVFKIPLIQEAQKFNIILNNVTYLLRLQWNTKSQAWVLDILTETESPLVSGIPLVPGVDLLGQYSYLNFGGQLIATSESPSPVSYSNLGISGQLYFVTP